MSGAGGENRTLIACLEGRHISHYTTPADLPYYTLFSEQPQSVIIHLKSSTVANVAHLVRASGCGSEGSGFNPHHSPHILDFFYILLYNMLNSAKLRMYLDK